MMVTKQTHIPVSSLYADDSKESRYGYKRSFIFQALKELGIERQNGADGVTAYITISDLETLDEYVDIRKMKGVKASEAFAKTCLSRATDGPVDSSIQPAETADVLTVGVSTDVSMRKIQLPPAVAVLVEAIASQLSPPTDTLAPQRQLKEAYTQGWLLSTAQVRQIVGVPSWQGSDRYGFRFEKVGKEGRQNSWQVLKASSE